MIFVDTGAWVAYYYRSPIALVLLFVVSMESSKRLLSINIFQ